MNYFISTQSKWLKQLLKSKAHSLKFSRTTNLRFNNSVPRAQGKDDVLAKQWNSTLGMAIKTE